MSRLPIPHLPLSAVSGQASFKQALILAAINPAIGGVLISGPRGCAKSTLARGLADVLPSHQMDGESPRAIASASFVTLPLGASEEMLLGTLDLQQVLSDRNVAFRPGLLSQAHGGVLYVDEVNLLGDNLVDLLLDVAASGVNRVERDGISHSHAAEFLLVGTMNPDEGELRAQLQDRFGLAVELGNRYSTAERVEIVRTREAFDRDPQRFCARYAAQQQELLERIHRARTLLHDIHCDDTLRFDIAERCNQAQVDGLRADIVWYRAALAHAAWNDRLSVTQADVDAVEELVLAHRRKQCTPPREQSSPPPQNPPSSPYRRPPEEPGRHGRSDSAGSGDEKTESNGDWGGMEPQLQQAAAESNLLLGQVSRQQRLAATLADKLSLGGKKKGGGAAGARAVAADSARPGWFATLVANVGVWPPKTIRFQKQRSGLPVLHLILIDTSASILGQGPFSTAKAAALQIAEQAYLNREQLAIMGFGNNRVDTLLRRVRAPKELAQLLNNVPAGGGTPMREALRQAQDYLQRLKRKIPAIAIRTYLLTDGRTSAQVGDIRLEGECVLIDTERCAVKRGRGEHLAAELGAAYLPLPA